MLHFWLDNHSGVPSYRQIMEQIKYYSASGVLVEGSRLPSIRDLARQLAVNPTTIVKAYTELQHEGMVEMLQGRGAFLTGSGLLLGEEDRSAKLRPMVCRLVVEAMQLGVGDDVLKDLLQDEIRRFKK